MLFVTTCCIYKSTCCIYLFNNCKEKFTFSTRPRVLRDQISQEILVGCVIFLCLSKFYLPSFTWSKLHSKNWDERVFIILYFSHFTSEISGQQCMDLEADLTWKTCNFGLTKKLPCTDSFIYKIYWTIPQSLEAFLFEMNRDNSGNSIDLILVGECPPSVIR